MFFWVRILTFDFLDSPMEHKYYEGPAIEEIPSINSWQSCSSICSNNPRCYYWTWYTPSYINIDLRKVCSLRSSTATFKLDESTRSGTKRPSDRGNVNFI